MQKCTLTKKTDFPDPPLDKKGWPWTDSYSLRTNTSKAINKYPVVIIITPSFNQGRFLEETIRSVLFQDYPKIEYIIIDGGSTDESVDIIKKYEPWLSHWVSEPDQGQSNAINKGWKIATGDILAWINSDDVYCPGAIKDSVEALLANPGIGMTYSDIIHINDSGEEIRNWSSRPFDYQELLVHSYIPQPTVFIRRNALDKVGFLNEELHLAMDLDLWLRIGRHFPILYLEGKNIAKLRIYSGTKSYSRQVESWNERFRILDNFFNDPQLSEPILNKQQEIYARSHLLFSSALVSIKHYNQAMTEINRAILSSPTILLKHWSLCVKIYTNIILKSTTLIGSGK